MVGTPKRDWLLSRYDGFLVPGLYCFLVGNALGWALPTSALFGWGAVWAAVLVAVVCVVCSQKNWTIRTALWLLILVLGGVYQVHFAFRPDAFDISRLAPAETAVVEGVVLRRERDGRKGQLAVMTANGGVATGKLQVSKTPVPLPQEGQRVRLEGKLERPRAALFEGGFDYAQYLRTQHIAAVIKGVTAMYVGQGPSPTLEGRWLQMLGGIRERISGIFPAAMASPQSEVVAGVVLGSHAVPIDDATKGQFISTGLIHLLAASGLNVGIVAGFILWVSRGLRAKPSVGLVLALFGVVVYTLLAGASPSVLRAGTMLGMALVFKLLDRDLSPLFLLGLAATALVLWDPLIIGSLGFQFSVLTTFGLITMVPPLQAWLGYYVTRWVAGLVLVPTVAQLWVLPLSIYHFNQFPLHSVPLNIVAVALVVPITAIGFLASGLALVWQPLGITLVKLCWPFAKALTWLVALGDDMAWAQWHPASPSPAEVAGFYGVLVLAAVFGLSLKTMLPSKKLALISAALALVLLPRGWQGFAASDEDTFTVVPISETQHAVVIKPAQTRWPLIIVPKSFGYWEGRNLSDYLKHRQINTLAALVFWQEAGTRQKALSQDGLAPLLTGRTVARQIDLANLTQPAVRFGAFTLHNLNAQPGRLFQLNHQRAPGLCLLGTQLPGDSAHCPLTLFKRPFGETAFWHPGPASHTPRSVGVTLTGSRVRLQ